MGQQLGKMIAFDLTALNGQVVPWRTEHRQPWVIAIDGIQFVAIFEDEGKLESVMAHLGVVRTAYTLKGIDNAPDFIASVHEAGVKVCFNVHPHGAKLRYTEIRMLGRNG
jgi:hypothetical protein